MYDNISLNYPLSEECFRQISRENQNTCFCSIISFSPNFVSFMEKYDAAIEPTDENIIRRLSFPCWINEARTRHSDCVILTVFP
jgi:hypothetical protein